MGVSIHKSPSIFILIPFIRTKVVLTRLLRLLFFALKGNFRSRIICEILLVRQENATLVRKGYRPKLKSGDRLIFGFLAGMISRKRLPKISATFSHPFIERAIGTVRREFLDQVLVWNQSDLEQKLDQFKEYYNHYRVHSALDGKSPSQARQEFAPPLVNKGNWQWKPMSQGLFHVPQPLSRSEM